MGKGLYTNEELIDSMMIDLNKSVQNLVNGSYLAWCKGVGEIAQKLIVLKKSVSDEVASKNRRIEELKQNLRDCGAEVTDIPIEEFMKKDGADNGAE